MVLSETYWISFTVLGFAMAGSILAICYKSKCSHYKICFGIFDIERNVDDEVAIDRARVGLPHCTSTALRPSIV